MPKSAVKEDSPYPIEENTLIPVQLVKVEEVTIEYTVKEGKNAGERRSFTKWEWTFSVTGGEYGGLTVKGNSEAKVTNADFPSGRLNLARPWAEVLLGRSLYVGEDLDTDDLLGLTAQATVHHMEPRAKKDGQGFWFNVELNELFPLGEQLSTEPPF